MNSAVIFCRLVTDLLQHARRTQLDPNPNYCPQYKLLSNQGHNFCSQLEHLSPVDYSWAWNGVDFTVTQYEFLVSFVFICMHLQPQPEKVRSWIQAMFGFGFASSVTRSLCRSTRGLDGRLCSHFTFYLHLFSICPLYHLARKLILLSSGGILCICRDAELPRLFPPCSIALAAAAVLSRPRILFCNFYPKSVQKHCAFRFPVNIVTALTTEKTPKPCLLKHTIWKFLAFLFSEGLSIAAFKP